MSVFNFLWDFLNIPRNGRGQAMTEYLLIISIIAVGLIVVFVAFGDNLKNLVENIVHNITGERDDDIEQEEVPSRGGGHGDF